MADLVIILIAAGVAAAIWRFVIQFRKLRAEDRMYEGTKPLGMEATDVDRFNLEKGAQVGPGQFLSANPILDNVSARQRAFTKTLNPDEIHKRYDVKDSATNLVKGIATHNPVVHFMDGKPETTHDKTTQLICDLFGTLEITVKAVDVPADPSMHLGLPQKDGKADLPYLYIDGNAVGGAEEVLAMAQSGTLQDLLIKEKIRHNADAARALTSQPSI